MSFMRRRILINGWGRRWVSVVGALVLFASAESSMGGEFTVKAVGRVSKQSGRTALEIFPEYQDALLGLSRFSHVMVLYWFDRNDTPEKRALLQVHPRGNKRNPLSGVFATRSPVRPNLIGLSVCRIRSVQDGLVVIDRIDAFDRSPILDLKPYISRLDCFAEAVGPKYRPPNTDGRKRR